MALKIRLARGGAKKRPYYSIVVADSRSPRDGRFIEKVGTYNPMLERDHQNRIRLNEERIKHWMGMGALPTDRVALFLGNAGIIEKQVRRDTPVKSAPKAKAQERMKAEAAAQAAAADAAQKAEEAAKAAAAAPVPAEEPAPEAAPPVVEDAVPEEPAAETPTEA